MASLTLPHSIASSFPGHFHVLSSPSPVRTPYRSPRTGHGTVVSVRATIDIVLVDKSEAEKTYRLKTTYLEKIVPLLKEEFKYTNVHQVPKIEKIVVNCGMGDAGQNSKGLEAALKDMAQITGQRPVKTRARASIATFKIREGQPLGIAATLRGEVSLPHCLESGIWLPGVMVPTDLLPRAPPRRQSPIVVENVALVDAVASGTQRKRGVEIGRDAAAFFSDLNFQGKRRRKGVLMEEGKEEEADWGWARERGGEGGGENHVASMWQ